MASTGSGSSIPRIQVFRPTMEEFQNFSKYIEKIEESGAHKAGLAKIIPPESWNPRKRGYDDIDLTIPAPISQYVTGRQGLYQQYNIQQKAMTVKEFKKLAEGTKFKTPSHFDYEDLERKYWKNITYNSPIYGADVSGSLYDKNVEEFNIQHLNTILDLVKDDYEIQIEGVNTAYLYFGMWKTTFAWHTEDMDLYSINYLHFGAPKSWYAIPPEHGRRLERLAANFFHGSSSACPAFLRHKMTIISPQILKQYCIPFNKITQEPGEFMITFPFGYHSGFNHGFNCAESTNFALPRWVEYGKRAISCTCRNDCVKICMDMFVRKFQPDRYELWKQGKDIGTHPEDPTRHYAAPAPKKLELALAAQREERRKAKMLQTSSKIKRNPVSKLDKNNKKYKMISESDEIIRNHEDSDSKGTEIYDMNVEEEDDVETKEFNSETSQEDSELFLSDMEAVQHVEISTTIAESEDTEADDEDDQKSENMEDDEDDKKSENMEDDEDDKKSENVEDEEAKACEAKVSTDRVMLDNQKGSDSNKIVEGTIISNSNEIVEETIISDCNASEISCRSIPLAKRDNFELSQNFEKQDQSSPIDEALLLRFPALRQAIDSGALALTCITPTPFELSSPSCTAKSSTLQNTHQQAKVQTEEPFILGDVPITNLSSLYDIRLKPKMDVKKSSFSSGNWKCEQTQGLKVRLAKQSQPVYPSDSTPTFTSFKLDSSFSKEYNHQNSKEPNVSPSEFNKSLLSTSHTIPPSTEEISATNQRLSSMIVPLKSLPVSLSHQSGNESDTKNELDFAKSESKSKKDHHKRDPSKNVKAADDSVGNWAQPVLKLWQHYPFEFEEEKKFNIHCSTIEPHCAVCVVFSPCNITKDYPNPPIKVPANSKVKMPPFCFGNNLENQTILDSNPLLSRDGTAPLLVCSVCQVCVHATCYGITMLQMGSWMCSRCSNGGPNVECCLCVMRGGALKPTSNGGWAHILCAVLIPETYFENVIFKEPINVSRLTPTRLKLKCRYCLKSGQNQSLKGKACVQCLSGKCYLPFHVTCGYVAGVIYDATDWPEPLNVSCTRHSAARRKPSKRIFTSVNMGDKVIAKHKKNKRYYWVQVKRVYLQEYYSILFEDNSTSTNTLPEDIVGREVSESGTPNINEKVKVKWTDGIIYNAIFKGSRSCKLYVIEFDDGVCLTQERHQIYASDENIPKEILSKIGTATESRLIDYQKGNDGKRVRISNSKYV